MSTEIYIRTTPVEIFGTSAFTPQQGRHLGIWIVQNGITTRIDGVPSDIINSRYSTALAPDILGVIRETQSTPITQNQITVADSNLDAQDKDINGNYIVTYSYLRSANDVDTI